jgi:hypothetical protein
MMKKSEPLLKTPVSGVFSCQNGFVRIVSEENRVFGSFYILTEFAEALKNGPI